jgi:hypothetical protein
MITDTQSPSIADRVPAAPAAGSRRDIDPALASPMVTDDVAGIAAPPLASGDTALAPLFRPEEAQGFRDSWEAVQIGFVDDPKLAVRQADELVARVVKTLAESFAGERSKLESRAQTLQASTEDLRVALRRYRSFLQRMLAF